MPIILYTALKNSPLEVRIFNDSSQCEDILHNCVIDPDDRKSGYNYQLCKHSFGGSGGNRSKNYFFLVVLEGTARKKGIRLKKMC